MLITLPQGVHVHSYIASSSENNHVKMFRKVTAVKHSKLVVRHDLIVSGYLQTHADLTTSFVLRDISLLGQWKQKYYLITSDIVCMTEESEAASKEAFLHNCES